MAIKKYGVSMVDCDLFISEDKRLMFKTKEGRLYELKEVAK